MSVEATTNGTGRREADPGGAATGSDARRSDPGAILIEAVAELRGFAAGLLAIVELEWRRLKLRAVDALLHIALFGVLLVAALAAAAAAGVVFVLGTRDALTKWSGSEWVGQLAAGVLLLLAFGLAWSVVRRRIRRRWVAAAVRPATERKSS